MVTVQGAGGGILFIFIGVVLIGGGIVFWDSCASGLPAGVTANCTAGPAVLWIFGALCLFSGIFVLASSISRGPRTIRPTIDPAIPPPLIRPVVVQQLVVQRTSTVRCRYCGNLNLVTATNCASCGAKL